MASEPTLRVGRYQLFHVLAAGGMGAVYAGRIFGTAGFSRTVAIKRLHPHLASDPELVAAFADEARIASRIQHPNVVSTLDVVSADGELFIVMEYVHGASLAKLIKLAKAKGTRAPARVVVAIVIDALYGLHAAHEATGERGNALHIVHRDVSPQNLLVGAEGVTRIADFGIAKASSRLQSTRDGAIKGKIPYMSPEQIGGATLDRRTDVYAAGVVLWEALAQRSLFGGPDPTVAVAAVLEGQVPRIADEVTGMPSALDDVIAKALRADPSRRFATALDLARAISDVVAPAPPHDVAAWVNELAGETLAQSRIALEEIELQSGAYESTPSKKTESPTPSATPNATIAGTPAEPTSTNRAPRRRTMAAVLLVIAAGAGAASFVLARRHDHAAAAAPPSSIASDTPMPASPLPLSPVVDGSSTTSATPAARGAASTSASAPVGVVPTSPRRVGKTRPVCDPPFVVDRDGVKRYKPECI